MTQELELLNKKELATRSKRGLVISDLHLFSSRSNGFSLMDEIWNDLSKLDVLVLNGDIFDFRWSQLTSEEETINEALKWLQKVVEISDDIQIHYIIGNHDCIVDFTKSIKEFSNNYPHLEIHDTQLILDRLLFIHGDCTNWNMSGSDLLRFRDSWSQKKMSPRSHLYLYNVMDKLGLSKGFHNCYYPRSVTVKRVAHHLDTILPDWRNSIDDCYFGHTHLPFSDYSLEGVRFHNTGSGIRGMKFLPLHFQINPPSN